MTTSIAKMPVPGAITSHNPSARVMPPLISPTHQNGNTLRAASAETSWRTPRTKAHQPMISTTTIAVLLGQIMATRPATIETMPRASSQGFLAALAGSEPQAKAQRPVQQGEESEDEDRRGDGDVCPRKDDQGKNYGKCAAEDQGPTGRFRRDNHNRSFKHWYSLVFGAYPVQASVFQSMTGELPRVAPAPNENAFSMAKLGLCFPK